MSQEAYNTRIRSVWPDPDNNLRYAQPSYNGQKYISTGLFPVATLDANANERGREIANCSLVTSLFFDADLVQLWAASSHACRTESAQCQGT
jgi:hypothetical protein